ncbi:MAG: hypothetical protein ACRDTG_17125 [Pseudonocardiaceae bacterium]
MEQIEQSRWLLRTTRGRKRNSSHARSGNADRADEYVTAAHELIARGIPTTSPYYNIIATNLSRPNT